MYVVTGVLSSVVVFVMFHIQDNIIATCDELAHEMKEIKKVLRQSEVFACIIFFLINTRK